MLVVTSVVSSEPKQRSIKMAHYAAFITFIFCKYMPEVLYSHMFLHHISSKT